MAELARYQRSEAAQAVPTSKEAANNLFSLAERLRAFSNREHDRLDQQAQIEGKQAGLDAASGVKGGIDLSDNSTIRARAFNQGAQIAHAAAIKIDINENIERLKLENQYNLEAFQEKAAGYKKGLLAEVDPVMRAMAEADIDASISSGTIAIGREIHKRDEEEHLGMITKGSELLLRNIENFSRDGQLEEAQANLDQLELLLTEGVEAGLVTPANMETTLAQANELSDAQILFGGLKRILEEEGLDAAEQAVEDFAKAKLAEDDISATSRDNIVTKMETLLSRERSDISRENAIVKAERAVKTKVIKREAKLATYALQHGQIPDDVDELIQRAQLNGDIEVAQDLSLELAMTTLVINKKIGDEGIGFMHLAPQRQEAIINKLAEKKNLAGVDAKLLERYRTVHSHVMSELNSGNAMRLAVEQGVISELPQIDFSDPKMNPADFYEERMKLHEIVEARYQTEVSPFTPIEAESLISYMDDPEVSVAAKSLAMKNIVDGLDDSATKVMLQLYEKDAPEYTMVGELMIEGAALPAMKIMEGMNNLKTGLVKNPTDLNETIRAKISDYGDVFITNPTYETTVIEAVEAIYATLEKASTGANDKLVKKAIDMVTGGILEIDPPDAITNYFVIAPRRGMRANTFRTRLTDAGLHPNDIEVMGGVHEVHGYTNEEVVDVIQESRLISYRKGVYWVLLNDDLTEPHYLKGKDGEPFEFQFYVKAGLEETYQ